MRVIKPEYIPFQAPKGLNKVGGHKKVPPSSTWPRNFYQAEKSSRVSNGNKYRYKFITYLLPLLSQIIP